MSEIDTAPVEETVDAPEVETTELVEAGAPASDPTIANAPTDAEGAEAGADVPVVA